MHPDLPEGVRAYKRSPTFTRDTIPEGFKTDHNTKAGVWGVIHVTEGRLRYIIPARGVDALLEAGDRAVIKPEEKHRVAADGAVSFFVDFCR